MLLWAVLLVFFFLPTPEGKEHVGLVGRGGGELGGVVPPFFLQQRTDGSGLQGTNVVVRRKRLSGAKKDGWANRCLETAFIFVDCECDLRTTNTKDSQIRADHFSSWLPSISSLTSLLTCVRDVHHELRKLLHWGTQKYESPEEHCLLLRRAKV